MPVMDNAQHLRTPLQKADFALSYLTTENGELKPGQAKKFIRLMIKKAKMMGDMNVYGIKEQKAYLNMMRFSSRVLKAGTQGQALAAGDRSRPTLSDALLDTELFKCQVDIEEEVFEDNIEGEGLRNTIMQMLGEAIARDVEWIAVNGDSSSSDPALAKIEGILKLATSHTVNASSALLSRTLLRSTRRALPHEYKAKPSEMRIYTSVNAEEDYSNEVADRMTPLGDKAHESDAESFYRKTPVIAVPEFPEDYGGADTTAALYTYPKGIHIGIHKAIKLRVVEDVKAGMVSIVGKIRFDVQYENEDAAVKLYGVSVA